MSLALQHSLRNVLLKRAPVSCQSCLVQFTQRQSLHSSYSFRNAAAKKQTSVDKVSDSKGSLQTSFAEKSKKRVDIFNTQFQYLSSKCFSKRKCQNSLVRDRHCRRPGGDGHRDLHSHARAFLQRESQRAVSTSLGQVHCSSQSVRSSWRTHQGFWRGNSTRSSETR